MKKVRYIIILICLYSCDYEEKEKQVTNEIDENMSHQSKMDSIEAEFYKQTKKLESDSI